MSFPLFTLGDHSSERAATFFKYTKADEGIAGYTDGCIKLWNLNTHSSMLVSYPFNSCKSNQKFSNYILYVDKFNSCSSCNLVFVQSKTGFLSIFDCERGDSAFSACTNAVSFARCMLLQTSNSTNNSGNFKNENFSADYALIVSPIGHDGSFGIYDIRCKNLVKSASTVNNDSSTHIPQLLFSPPCCTKSSFPAFNKFSSSASASAACSPIISSSLSSVGMLQSLQHAYCVNQSSVLVAYEAGILALYDIRKSSTKTNGDYFSGAGIVQAAKSNEDALVAAVHTQAFPLIKMATNLNQVWLGTAYGDIYIAKIKSNSSIKMKFKLFKKEVETSGLADSEAAAGKKAEKNRSSIWQKIEKDAAPFKHQEAANAGIGDIAVRNDGFIVSIGNWSGKIEMFECKKLRRICSFKHCNKSVNSMSFNFHNGAFAYTNSGKENVTVCSMLVDTYNFHNANKLLCKQKLFL